MKKLIAIETLGLALSSSSLSVASDYMGWLHTKPVIKNEIRNEIKSGKVEGDFMSFYTSPKKANTAAPLITAEIPVFGVQIPRSPDHKLKSFGR